MPGLRPGVWYVSAWNNVVCAHSRTTALNGSRSIQHLYELDPAVIHSGSHKSRVLVVSDLSNLPSVSSSSVVEPRLRIDSALQHLSALTVRESFCLAVSCFSSISTANDIGFFHEIAVLMTLIVLINLQSVRGGKI